MNNRKQTNFVNTNFARHKNLLPSRTISGSFSFRPTTVTIIEKFIRGLDDSSSPGISGIPVVLLKACAKHIAPFLCQLFNECVRQSRFPDEFKFALVSPLFKNKGTAQDMNNYRGISVLPPIGKLFEKILAEQLRIYFEVNGLLFNGQHGFRESHSCETALHEIISACLANMDKKLINILLFIDFKKAFDLVKPKLLFVKLLNYGLTNEAIKLLINYFERRMQSVKISRHNSEPTTINLGVPQGSVLGPLLFIIYINDLPFFLDSILTKLFADDTTLHFSDNDVDSVVSRCKTGIFAIMEWCKYNYLYINWSKTNVMFITNKRIDLPKHIVFGDIKIEVVCKFKLLGITLDSKLNFLDHVSNLSKSINSKLYAIRRIFYLSFNVKIQFFKTFLLPYFDFGLSLIFYFSKVAISKLARIYYSCLFKLFKFNFSNFSVIQINKFLFSYNLFSFEHRILYKLSIFSFNIKNKQNSPIELKNFLRPPETIHSYSLRNSTKSLVQSDVFLSKYGEWSFGSFFSKFFNKIPENRILFFENNLSNFKSLFFNNFDIILSNFVIIFYKFNLSINFSYICY